MGRPRTLGTSGIDPITEEPHHPRGSSADSVGPYQAVLACVISAQASAVLAVMRRGLRHPRATPPSTRSSPPSARYATAPSPPLPPHPLPPRSPPPRCGPSSTSSTPRTLAPPSPPPPSLRSTRSCPSRALCSWAQRPGRSLTPSPAAASRLGPRRPCS
ncbi:unnamed protein product [Urochloa humidicola]